MEKISGILPSSQRIRSVDLEGHLPVRPGVPGFGRPLGMTSSEREQLRKQQAILDGDPVRDYGQQDRVEFSDESRWLRKMEPRTPLEESGQLAERLDVETDLLGTDMGVSTDVGTDVGTDKAAPFEEGLSHSLDKYA